MYVRMRAALFRSAQVSDCHARRCIAAVRTSKTAARVGQQRASEQVCLVWGEGVFIPHAQPQQELDAVGWESTSPLEPPVEQAGSLDLGLRRRN